MLTGQDGFDQCSELIAISDSATHLRRGLSLLSWAWELYEQQPDGPESVAVAHAQ